MEDTINNNILEENEKHIIQNEQPQEHDDGASLKNEESTEILEEEPKNLLISLLSELKIGVDLSRVPLPTFILEPRSLLEKFTDYMIHGDILCGICKVATPLERIQIITKWYLSGFYFRPKGVKKPYNPILGEIFRSKWEFNAANKINNNTNNDNHNNSNINSGSGSNDSGTLNTSSQAILVAEQISHHPPVSCVYISNRNDGYTMSGVINPRSKFLGTSMAVIVDGSITLSLLELQEEYVITFPTACARGIIFGTLLTEIVGPATIVCKKTNLTSEMEFKAKSMFRGEYNVVSGKIKLNNETTHNFTGKWDKKIEITQAKKKGSSEILWDCSAVKKNKTIIRPINQQEEFESQKLWQKVTQAILNKNQKDATVEKNKLEDDQRKRVKERKDTVWEPRLFKKIGDQWVYKYANTTLYQQGEPKEIETEGIIYFEGTSIENLKNKVEPCGASENEISIFLEVKVIKCYFIDPYLNLIQ
ncbi:hypothetical protein DICPUDRAFT_84515 [Dictyostelium purpureum]|uniref:Oxysterol binding family protein n=1 Tax=Dictyostelium purpureum TaxID=5786 RepID=F1A2W6_DICPU|nr:uncharacterized protein DICPUDRAFT_84515 [Dictyostelium purpureum]EGC29466.1 hypothetical protein DICPUDRAFT_84515 [Dictyostelium purpureum]|eukprot:XP_003294009.1 hypothetical protein DICPUDRAFT_84515 [Dictyostelium purpureum]